MKNIIFLLLSALTVCGTVWSEDEGPVCHQCEKIREYNEAHPENNYYWYDDYLKEKKEGTKNSAPEDRKDKQPSDKIKATK